MALDSWADNTVQKRAKNGLSTVCGVMSVMSFLLRPHPSRRGFLASGVTNLTHE